MCRVLKISRSGYYEWRSRAPSAHALADQALLPKIRHLHVACKEAYGAVKTWKVLNQQGVSCGKHRVARLRREADIEARRKRRFRITVLFYNRQRIHQSLGYLSPEKFEERMVCLD